MKYIFSGYFKQNREFPDLVQIASTFGLNPADCEMNSNNYPALEIVLPITLTSTQEDDLRMTVDSDYAVKKKFKIVAEMLEKADTIVMPDNV